MKISYVILCIIICKTNAKEKRFIYENQCRIQNPLVLVMEDLNWKVGRFPFCWLTKSILICSRWKQSRVQWSLTVSIHTWVKILQRSMNVFSQHKIFYWECFYMWQCFLLKCYALLFRGSDRWWFFNMVFAKPIYSTMKCDLK